MTMKPWRWGLSVVVLYGLPGVAFAQPVRDDPPSETDIIVTGIFQRDLRDSASPVSILAGAALDRELRPQIGEALTAQAGVSATSFGPNASRPILRGLAGERVRVLTDGIGAFDVSNTSADHAVAIDPLLAERIEVLRGPASLRYGSSAIGGVVNVLDRRIPVSVPADGFDVALRGTLASAAGERAIGGNATVALGQRFAVTAGVGLADNDDLRTGGFILSRALRDQVRANGDADIAALADLKGRIPNTQASTRTANLGAAFIDDGGTLGLSVSRYESEYGLPVRFSLEPGAEQDAVSIDAKQTRADLRARVNILAGPLESIAFRGGYADYAHVEREGDGGIGTLFANEGYEARLELRQRRVGGWQGVVGVQTFFRDFLAVGAEAFVPPNGTFQTGLFTLQEFDTGALRFEVGGRYESTNIKSGDVTFDRTFNAASVAGGVFWAVAPRVKFGLNLSSTARAPSAEELLANGPHVGTQSYEIGDPGFGIERARGIEAVLRLGGGRWRIDAAAYHSRFSDYIYEFETGAVIDDLPVFQFAQGDARYEGFEVEAAIDWIARPGLTIGTDMVFDAVRATIDDFGPAPRIPPLRIRGGTEVMAGAIGVRAEGEWIAAQRRVTGFETETEGFATANVSANWKPVAARDIRVTLAANNLFDAVGRRHASFLKDYAPLAGRDVRLAVSARF
jgi:iron complex outermembrane receptor protein